jgi:dihydrofolate reductase
MTINAILACDTQYGIGRNGGLPWPHNPADMKWFADNTRDGVVVMGRKTWDSLGNMRLKGRVNVVLSSDVESVKGNPDIAYSVGPNEMQKLLQNLEMEYPTKKIWIIGGGEIYRQALPFCNNLYLTKFKESYDCDTFINSNQLKVFQQLTSEKQSDECSFSIWSRV